MIRRQDIIDKHMGFLNFEDAIDTAFLMFDDGYFCNLNAHIKN